MYYTDFQVTQDVVVKFKKVPTLICVSLGLILTAVVSYYWYAQVSELEQKRFETEALQLNDLLEDQLQNIRNRVIAVAALFDASEVVTEKEFTSFCNAIPQSGKSLRALEWAPKLKENQLEQYEEQGRKLHPDYSIKITRGLGHPQYYFPILYITPLLTNEGVFGYDLASSKVRYAAISAAINENKPVASGVVDLKQSPGTPSVLIFTPVYEKGAKTKDMSTAMGVVGGIIDFNELVNDTISRSQHSWIGIRIYSEIDGQDKLISGSKLNAPDEVSIKQDFQINFSGTVLHVEYYSNKSYFASDIAWVGPLIIVFCLLLTAGITVYLNQLIAREEITQELVRNRTAELKKYSDEVRLIYQVISIYAETKDINIILQKCIQIICEVTGWPIGHVYEVDKNKLKPMQIWRLDDESRNQEFYETTMKTFFEMGVGLPGRVWKKKGAPIWILDIADDVNFPRGKVCEQCGLHSAFGFGVNVSGEVKYIFEFFCYDYIQEDQELLSICDIIRQQSNRFLDKQQVEAKLVVSEEQNRLILDTAGEGIYGLDIEGHGTFVNPAALKMLGFALEDLLGKEMHPLIHHHDANGRELSTDHCPIHKTLRDGVEVRRRGEFFWRKDGSSFPVEYLSTPIIKDGALVGAVITFNDITEETQAQKRLEYLATHDNLLGLPNRTTFEKMLTKVMETKNGHVVAFILLYLDLDNFKEVNDSLGHNIGDELLKQVVQRVRNTVGELALLGAVGGDEFAVVIQGDSDENKIRVICHKLLASIKEVFIIDDNYISTSISIGAIAYPGGGDTADVLIRNADIAMSQVKKSGRNNYRIYDKEIEAGYQRYLYLKNSLARAVEEQQLSLLYQPVVDIKSEKIVGVEALMRWEDPTLGKILPDEFIKLAEETGEIHKIGFWLLETALNHLTIINNHSSSIKSFAINLSPMQLVPKSFANELIRIVESYRLGSEQIVLEVTEHDLPENLEVIENAIRKFIEHGYRLYIDDFGTGSSSLARLNSIPFSGVKVDHSFVRNLPHDTASTAIIDVVMVLSKSLNVDVVVEGVERQDQLDYLRKSGCIKVQGFYYYKPMSLEQLLEHLKNQN